uniref:Uncharacterized protein n=1 Tax=Setaria viridis TaxID=4556 RepID=A0A4U6U259_SETVI|nr:hypothetical protein SEVIR_6G113120v2 [Setaria viridis]
MESSDTVPLQSEGVQQGSPRICSTRRTDTCQRLVNRMPINPKLAVFESTQERYARVYNFTAYPVVHYIFIDSWSILYTFIFLTSGSRFFFDPSCDHLIQWVVALDRLFNSYPTEMFLNTVMFLMILAQILLRMTMIRGAINLFAV